MQIPDPELLNDIASYDVQTACKLAHTLIQKLQVEVRSRAPDSPLLEMVHLDRLGNINFTDSYNNFKNKAIEGLDVTGKTHFYGIGLYIQELSKIAA